jgi:hypothetical protein
VLFVAGGVVGPTAIPALSLWGLIVLAVARLFVFWRAARDGRQTHCGEYSSGVQAVTLSGLVAAGCGVPADSI